MRTKLLIYRGGRPSDSARTLRQQLLAAGVDVKINFRGSQPRTRRKILNWGTSDTYACEAALNDASCVKDAIDKRMTLWLLQQQGVSVPYFTTDQAGQPNDTGKIWLARTVLGGSGGEGIVVVRPGETFPDAQLFVLYIPKTREYRVHVFDGEVIFVQQKKRKSGYDHNDDELLIRNHDNGYVFVENSVTFDSPEEEEAVKQECIKAVGALNLDFGAVDVIVGRDDGDPYVLEVNTAPGLASTNLISAYVERISRWANT